MQRFKRKLSQTVTEYEDLQRQAAALLEHNTIHNFQLSLFFLS